MGLTFGGHVRWLRIKAGKQQNQVAAEAGLNPATLSKIENDKTELPDKETIRALARALHADEDDLLWKAGYRVDRAATEPARFDLFELDRRLVKEGYSQKHAEAVMTLLRQLAPEEHPLVDAMNLG